MFTSFDAGTVILLGCLGVVWWRLGLRVSRGAHALAAITALGGTAAVRVIGGPAAGLDVAAALLLAVVGVGIGRSVIARRAWPAGALAIALAVITAAGAYLRAYRLDEVLEAPDRVLQPDVRYYREQALRTANPFAAGHKSPLWPALNAPIVRALGGSDASMRILSWCCGVAMLPLAGWALGRLLHPLAGVLTAAMLAVQPWIIDLCCEGLREEAGVCLWMVMLVLLYAEPDSPWRSPAAGLVGGLLLLLRNTFLVPLFVLAAWAIVYRRWSWLRAGAVAALPLLIVSPFYINQYRAFGDAFAMEKRDARYHANLEFGGQAVPGLSMPSPEEHREDLYAGEPLSPLAYLFKYHTPGDAVRRQWQGASRIITGRPFVLLVDPWFGLAGAAAVFASLAVRRARFAGLFVLASSLGIIAHLMTVHPVELRLLLGVLVVWVGAAWWLIVSLARIGISRMNLSENDQSKRSSGERLGTAPRG